MKNQIVAFITTALMASLAFAQNTSTTKMPKYDGISSKGFRVSILKPMLEMELKAKSGNLSGTDKINVNDTLGLAVGYASLPVQAFGWTANLAYLELKEGGDRINMYRADGNVAYAFTKFVNAKGGLNLSKFTSKNFEKLDPAIGLQASVGFQATRNFGVDLGYVMMNQKKTIDDVNYNLKESGFEIALNGTF